MVPARPATAPDVTCGYRLRFRRGQHDVRPDRDQGVALQGRAPGATEGSRRGVSRARAAASAASGVIGPFGKARGRPFGELLRVALSEVDMRAGMGPRGYVLCGIRASTTVRARRRAGVGPRER